MNAQRLGETRFAIGLGLAVVCASLGSGFGLALINPLFGFWKDAMLYAFLSIVPSALIGMLIAFPAFLLFRRGPHPPAFFVVGAGALIGAMPYGLMMVFGAATGDYVAYQSLLYVMGVHTLSGSLAASVFYMACTFRRTRSNVR